jgi:hypothetical protein
MLAGSAVSRSAVRQYVMLEEHNGAELLTSRQLASREK